MAVTRFGLEGYGVRRAGSFAGKTPAGVPAHPVGILTRLSPDGYGARRYAANAFAGKTPASSGGGQSWLPATILNARRKIFYRHH
jgi:hypothetical protein